MENTFENLPKRIFLDSSVLQTLQDYGEYIYDVGELEDEFRILRTPNGLRNLNALRDIMIIAQRANFEFALSENSLNEVVEKVDFSYMRWAHEMLDYWIDCIKSYETHNAFSGKGKDVLKRIKEEQFDYLSIKDKLLIFDAVLLECDAFLTMEEKLTRNAENIEKKLGLRILRPFEYCEVLQPWAALFY
jgi:hypothetical protein